MIKTIFGTGDVLILHKYRYHIDLADYKFGRGAVGEAHLNVQLLAYALAAIQKYEWAETIAIHIILPRRDEILQHCFTRAEVLAGQQRIRLIVERALSEDQKLNPNTEACKYCGQRVKCPALAKKLLPLATKYEASAEDFELELWEKMDPVEVTDPVTLGKMKRVGSVIERWKKAVDAQALHLASTEGVEIPGFNLYYRNPTAKFDNTTDVAEALSSSLSPEAFTEACNVSVPQLAKAYAEASGETQKAARAHVESLLVKAGLIPEDDDIEQSAFLRADPKF